MMTSVTASKRYAHLRSANTKMLEAWKRSLNAPQVLSAAFPTLSSGPKPVEVALQSLYGQFWEQLSVNVMVRCAFHNGRIDYVEF